MLKHILLLPLLFLCISLSAQSPKWINYANSGAVWDIFPEQDHVWASSDGGLLRIDRATGERKIFQPWNSGLRGSEVSSVRPSPDGSLWVSGSYGGLFRFDGGNTWEQFYYINTGDTLIDIKNLQVTAEGKLWFISNVHANCSGCTKLFHYNGSQFSDHSDALEAVLGNNGVRALCLDMTGQLWVNSGTKIVRYDGANVYQANPPLTSNEYITSIGFDKNNTLWVGTYQSLTSSYKYRLRYFNGNSWSELSESELGGEMFQVYKMFRDAQGDFYVSFYSESAYAKFDGNSWHYVKTTNLPNLPGIPNALLYTVDETGHQWFLDYSGTLLPMVYEFDGQNWKTYNTKIYPLAGNYITDVAFDCERNAWIAGDLLTRFDGVSWRDFTPQEIGLSSNYFSIWSLAFDTAHCNLWISYADNNGDPIGFSKYDGQSFTNYTTPDGYDVFETAIAKDGTVWAASSSSGLGKFDGNAWTWYNEQNAPISDFLMSVAVDQSNNVWCAAAYPSAIYKWDKSTWTIFDQSNSPVSGYSDWVYVDHAGMVWTSSATGLLRFNGTQWQEFAVPGTGTYGIHYLTQDQNHHFWMTNRKGVVKWDGIAFETFDFLEKPMASPYCWRVRVDPFGNKWISHASSGVSVFNENGISNQVINPTAGVKGTVYYDANQNGQQEPGGSEPGIPGEKVWLQPNHLAVFTNYDGNFTLFPAPGAYELQYDGNEKYTPTSAQALPFNMGASELNGFNYGAWEDNPNDSITIDLTLSNMRCNSEGKAWVKITNYGLLDAEGDVTLKLDPGLEFLHAEPAPVSVQGDLITWHYSNLGLYETIQFSAVFKVPGVSALGQILSLQSDATVAEGGTVSASDEDDERAEIRCSFDPNDKAMSSCGPSVGNYVLRDEALDFTVRFQNSGNDTAFTVMILDTLDQSLDFSTLELVSSSHPVRTTLSADGVLRFVFDRINLLWEAVDYVGSQGFVKYRIAPKPGLPDPTLVRNTAHIYFDLNPAIVTNTTESILVETLPSVKTVAASPEPDALARVYPNPNLGDFSIEWLQPAGSEPWKLRIADALGRVCYQAVSDQKLARIQGLSPGFYLVVIEYEGRIECHKLVVSRG